MTNGIKKKNNINLKKQTKKNVLCKSYLIKELKMLYRNPIFFMQCILPPLLFPLIFLIPSLMSLRESGEKLYILQTYLSDYVNTSIGLISAIEIIELFFIFNFTSITSISRDGESAKFMKYIPVDFEKQCKYKILIGTLLNIVPIIYVTVLLKILLVKTKIITLVYIFVLSMILNIFNNWLVIIIDLKHPKLEWMTEYAVVKQNLNMFYQMIIIITEMGLIFAIGFKIYNLNISMIFFSTLFIILTLLIKKYIKNNQRKLFNKIY
jgi:ABC-2 type transport system permease protein